MSKDVPPLPMELLEVEVAATCKQYRIEPEVARKILEGIFSKHPILLQKIAAHYPGKDVTRFGDYKAVIKEARKQVYYHLRQYHRGKEQQTQLKAKLTSLVHASAPPEQVKQVTDELLLTHISTQERFSQYQAFYNGLFAIVPRVQTIIDVGCGIHPLSYPFHREGRKTDLYVAIDKDQQAIDILTTFSRHVLPAQLIPRRANIAQLEQKDYLVNGVDYYDLAFMLKLIPVISRQEKELLLKLIEVPAHKILLMASTTAMTRTDKIAMREDWVLRQFINMTGRPILEHFQIENEFGYLLGEPSGSSAPSALR
ncbi:MAG TPA: hypothetical protein VH593_10400, partial [Ktedonobacteraceae bacterium]